MFKRSIRRGRGDVTGREGPFALRLGLAATALLAVFPVPHAQAKVPCDARYTLAGGTVTDEDTHLTWQQEVVSSGGSPCADGTGGCYAWAAAKAYCQGLQLAGGGWRMPHVFELQTIVDEGRVRPAVDPTAFAATPVDLYWSSTASAAWVVDFYAGTVAGVGPAGTGALRRIRCVR